MEGLKLRQIEFRSLTKNIDTSSSGGKFMFHVFSALAEFERDLRRERPMAGFQAALVRGRLGGRPKTMTVGKIRIAANLIKDPEVSIKDVCMTLGVSRATLYRYVRPNGDVRFQAEKDKILPKK